MAEKTHKFTVKFYSVNIEGDTPFESCLEHLLDDYKPDYSKKFLGPIKTRNGRLHWHGSIKYAQVDKIPDKINLDTGQQLDLELAEREGLLYQCAFMYVPKDKILLASKDVGAPGLETLEAQVKAKFSPKKLEIIPIFRKDLFDMLNGPASASSFCFRIGRQEMADDKMPADDIEFLEALDQVKYGVVTVKFEGRKDNPLDLSWIQQTAGKLMKREQVQELVINVKDDDEEGKTHLVHLTDYALSVKVELPYISRKVTIEEHERALEKAYAEEFGQTGITP